MSTHAITYISTPFAEILEFVKEHSYVCQCLHLYMEYRNINYNFSRKDMHNTSYYSVMSFSQTHGIRWGFVLTCKYLCSCLLDKLSL